MFTRSKAWVIALVAGLMALLSSIAMAVDPVLPDPPAMPTGSGPNVAIGGVVSGMIALATNVLTTVFSTLGSLLPLLGTLFAAVAAVGLAWYLIRRFVFPRLGIG